MASEEATKKFHSMIRWNKVSKDIWILQVQLND